MGRRLFTALNPARMSRPAVLIVALFLWSAAGTLRIVLSLAGQESTALIWEFVWYASAVILVQATFCRAAFALPDSRGAPILCSALPAAATVCNLLGLQLSYTTFFVAWPTVAQWASMTVLFGGACALFWFGRRTLFLGLAILGAVACAETGAQIWWQSRAVQDAADWRSEFPEEYGRPEFARRPNVYVLSWDALIPASIAEKFLGLGRSGIPYLRALEEGGARIFRNMFTDRIAPSLAGREINPEMTEGSRVFHNSLLFLDPMVWERHRSGPSYFFKGRDFPGQFHYFAGRRRSPLYEIFRENGYSILASYHNLYFGSRGAHVDRYPIPRESEGQCLFEDERRNFRRLGFCHARRLWHETEKFTYGGHLTETLQWIREPKRRPWLSMMYFVWPTHTLAGYRHTNQARREIYRQRFVSNAANAARLIDKILAELRVHDPEAIVFFVGDHGACLSRDLFSKDDMRIPERRRFYFLDSHAVVGAIYPADACAEEMRFDESFVTSGMVMRAIVKCLAGEGGEDPVHWETNYDLPYSDARFSDYVYE